LRMVEESEDENAVGDKEVALVAEHNADEK
jgi:hypothetical protein